jgi:hypothetical protein
MAPFYPIRHQSLCTCGRTGCPEVCLSLAGYQPEQPTADFTLRPEPKRKRKDMTWAERRAHLIGVRQ